MYVFKQFVWRPLLLTRPSPTHPVHTLPLTAIFLSFISTSLPLYLSTPVPLHPTTSLPLYLFTPLSTPLPHYLSTPSTYLPLSPPLYLSTPLPLYSKLSSFKTHISYPSVPEFFGICYWCCIGCKNSDTNINICFLVMDWAQLFSLLIFSKPSKRLVTTKGI